MIALSKSLKSVGQNGNMLTFKLLIQDGNTPGEQGFSFFGQSINSYDKLTNLSLKFQEQTLVGTKGAIQIGNSI